MKQNVSEASLNGSRLNIAPESDEIEVSVFGPGYGECILLHVGENIWFIVDSCIDPFSKEPAPLIYLRQINVDPTSSVKQVIATHWHDDHIRGLGKIIKTCFSAEFVCSGALRAEEFTEIVHIYGSHPMMVSSGVDEFREVLEALEERSRYLKTNYIPPMFAIANRCLWQGFPDRLNAKYNCSVYSLSPSDASILAAKLDFQRFFPHEKETKKRLIATSPNRAAVVLWVFIDNFIILLGSDLEETKDSKTGWSVIINSTSRPCGKASFFKIPHHGSKSAFNPGVWTEMLNREPLAVLTPYKKGNTILPTQEDVNQIWSLTDKAYATAAFDNKRIRKRDRTVEKTIRETVRKIRPIHTSIGHVRLRARLPNHLTIDLFGGALPLNKLYAS